MSPLSVHANRLVFVAAADPAPDFSRGEEIALGTLLQRYADATTASYTPVGEARPDWTMLPDAAVKYLGPGVIAYALNLWRDGRHVATAVTTDHDLLDVPADKPLSEVFEFDAPAPGRRVVPQAPKVTVFLADEHTETTLGAALDDYADCVVRMYRPAPDTAGGDASATGRPALDEVSAEAAGDAYRTPLALAEKYNGRHALHLDLLRDGRRVETLVVLDRHAGGFRAGQGVQLADWFALDDEPAEVPEGRIRVVTVQPQQHDGPHDPRLKVPYPYHVRPDGRVHTPKPIPGWPVAVAGFADSVQDRSVGVLFTELFRNPGAALGRYAVIEQSDGNLATVDQPIERVRQGSIPTPADYDDNDEDEQTDDGPTAGVDDWR
ncbi:hypothetical protein [Saccharothrix sp. HUAS TT1]|uniref:hypothetical protein n=1 Tax=unclassified Saccharothrix TaxID=2593673 RepID=UPI00345B8CDC